ncbi:hypothetical protein C8J57DRAFT_1505475 [Mycena rebaudengoi]|nr:hypothetical protein C8J57DRAFT_1472994 [Mycena rebaudengoi]KAJ7274713.1 hypothetical protein C8J57DRAFT_1505475 [Mycena rebaudengoi]
MRSGDDDPNIAEVHDDMDTAEAHDATMDNEVARRRLFARQINTPSHAGGDASDSLPAQPKEPDAEAYDTTMDIKIARRRLFGREINTSPRAARGGRARLIRTRSRQYAPKKRSGHSNAMRRRFLRMRRRRVLCPSVD